MVLERAVVQERLKELGEILQELAKYQHVSWQELEVDLSQRWIVERGLIAAASIILDVADHILAGHFGLYAETYERSLEMLCERGVLSQGLYDQLKGLGGFRNVLVHRYLRIEPREVFENYQKGLSVFPRYGQEILSWLDELQDSG